MLPTRGGFGKEMKLYTMPRAPLLGELSSDSETERLYRATAARKRCRKVYGSDAVKYTA